MREKAMGSVISNESVVSASVEDASDWYVLWPSSTNGTRSNDKKILLFLLVWL